MLTYEKYKSDCKRLGAKMLMDEATFNIMQGIETDKCEPPLQIRPRKNARKVDATHKNYEELT